MVQGCRGPIQSPMAKGGVFCATRAGRPCPMLEGKKQREQREGLRGANSCYSQEHPGATEGGRGLTQSGSGVEPGRAC